MGHYTTGLSQSRVRGCRTAGWLDNGGAERCKNGHEPRGLKSSGCVCVGEQIAKGKPHTHTETELVLHNSNEAEQKI